MKRSKHTQRVLAAALAASATYLVAGIASAAPATTSSTPATTVSSSEVEQLPAHNGLNLSGVVGLPLNPTANIPNKGSYRIQADYADLGDLNVNNLFGNGFDRSQKIGDGKFYGIHAAGAVGSRWEINGGIDFLRLHGERNVGADDDTFDFGRTDGLGFSIGAKYQAYHSADGSTLVAVGGGYSQSLFRNVNAYVVGSKAFGVGSRAVMAHLGARWDRFTLKGHDDYFGGDVDFDDSSSKASVFAGAEVPLDRSGRFSLVGEIGSKNVGDLDLGDLDFGTSTARVNSKFPYSASVRYARNGLAASVGIMRQGVTGDSGLFAQIGKTF